MKISSEVFSAGANRAVLLGLLGSPGTWKGRCCRPTAASRPSKSHLLGGFNALHMGWLTFLTPCKMSCATKEQGRDATELNVQREGYLSMRRGLAFPGAPCQPGPHPGPYAVPKDGAEPGRPGNYIRCMLSWALMRLKGTKARFYPCEVVCYAGASWPVSTPVAPWVRASHSLLGCKFCFVVLVCTANSSAEVLTEVWYWVNNK